MCLAIAIHRYEQGAGIVALTFAAGNVLLAGKVVDAAVVSHQHQVVARAFVCKRFVGELAVAAFEPVLAGHPLTQYEVRGLPGAQFRAGEQVGAVQAQPLQPLANAGSGLATAQGDPRGVCRLGETRARAYAVNCKAVNRSRPHDPHPRTGKRTAGAAPMA